LWRTNTTEMSRKTSWKMKFLRNFDFRTFYALLVSPTTKNAVKTYAKVLSLPPWVYLIAILPFFKGKFYRSFWANWNFTSTYHFLFCGPIKFKNGLRGPRKYSNELLFTFGPLNQYHRYIKWYLPFRHSPQTTCC